MSAARAKKKQEEQFDLFDALKLLETEKGIPVDYMIDKIKTAIAQAIKDARTMSRDQSIIVGLSGRGDKDMDNVRMYEESLKA